MTVCIAAACDEGKRIVTATDSLLSMGDVSGEAVLAKMSWREDWQFMYAGDPANFAMMQEEITKAGVEDADALSRLRVQETVCQAFRTACSNLASFEVLLPFNMTMEQFKEYGVAVFGETSHREMCQQISQRSSQIGDQIIVTGWGHSPHSAMIYELSLFGEGLHTASGFAAIGSGAQMAKTMLLLLGQARHRTLAETIFNVACAKFSAEKSSGLDVGRNTAIYVSRKRSDVDESGKPPGGFLQEDEIEQLREFWNSHLKPRIPDESRIPITHIAARFTDGEGTVRDMAECVNAANRLRQEKVRIYEEISREVQRDPEPTIGEQSHRQPLQESPEESGES